MGGGNSLINLGELSKPMTVLIEKISAAVGLLYQPHHVKRMAAAEGEAARISALAQIEISAVEQRALVRMVLEEGKKQENMEAVAAKAIADIEPGAKPEELDNDWLVSFFEKCRLVSNQEMQNMWSRILAGQTNHPASFSKRTIELVSVLEKSDADLFTSVCGFGWTFKEKFVPLIFDEKDRIYNQYGVDFGSLTHLESLGLVHFGPIGLYIDDVHPLSRAFYFDKQFTISPRQNSLRDFPIGFVTLTRAGLELAPICGSKKIEEFPEYAVSKWKKLGVEVSRWTDGPAPI
jgi:hypothetical protein